MPLIVALFSLFQFLIGGATDQSLARSNSSGVNWYLTDRLGSVTGITDSNGNLINTTQYDSYGHILSQSNPAVADQLAFTGREFDAETGLYYFRARYYNPDLGRFQSEDPIDFEAGDYNIKRYVFNSPTNGRDPSGLNTVEYTKKSEGSWVEARQIGKEEAKIVIKCTIAVAEGLTLESGRHGELHRRIYNALLRRASELKADNFVTEEVIEAILEVAETYKKKAQSCGHPGGLRR